MVAFLFKRSSKSTPINPSQELRSSEEREHEVFWVDSGTKTVSVGN